MLEGELPSKAGNQVPEQKRFIAGVLSVCVDSNGVLAKDRRLQFHQKGRSMNSTGSGKSSATVSR